MFFESERRVPQGLKPAFFQPCSARLKPRPFKTKQGQERKTRSTTQNKVKNTKLKVKNASFFAAR